MSFFSHVSDSLMTSKSVWFIINWNLSKVETLIGLLCDKYLCVHQVFQGAQFCSFHHFQYQCLIHPSPCETVIHINEYLFSSHARIHNWTRRHYLKFVVFILFCPFWASLNLESLTFYLACFWFYPKQLGYIFFCRERTL